MRAIMILLLVVAAPAPADAREVPVEDVCRLLVYWVEDGRSTSNFNVGEHIRVAVEDGVERTASFPHAESGMTVRAGVRYNKFGDSPLEITLAVALEGEPKNVFDEVGRSQATTFRGKDWGEMYVIKSVVRGAREYTYSFVCGNAKTWDRVFNRPLKKPASKD